MDSQTNLLEFRPVKQNLRIPQPSAKRIIKKLRRKKLKRHMNQRPRADSLLGPSKAEDTEKVAKPAQNEKIGLDRRSNLGAEVLSLIKNVDYYKNLN